MLSDHASLSIGVPHIQVDRIGSTNTFATEYIAKNNPTEGTVISAYDQTHGKGQIGRNWVSAPGLNITCSTILRPIFLDSGRQFQLNMAVSLAIKDLVDHLLDTEATMIKWPNDIYLHDRKIAGILIQNSLLGKRIHTSVIGTGINVNQTVFPDHLPNPTSMALHGEEQELDLVYGWLFRFLSKRYLQLKLDKVRLIEQEYKAALYRRDLEASYSDGGGNRFAGKIIDVDDVGRLIVLDTSGRVRKFHFREIQYILGE